MQDQDNRASHLFFTGEQDREGGLFWLFFFMFPNQVSGGLIWLRAQDDLDAILVYSTALCYNLNFFSFHLNVKKNMQVFLMCFLYVKFFLIIN